MCGDVAPTPIGTPSLEIVYTLLHINVTLSQHSLILTVTRNNNQPVYTIVVTRVSTFTSCALGTQDIGN